jgi:histone deacetylase 6
MISLGDYVYAFERILAPILKEFAPEIILISAGFDAARRDPIGGIDVPPEGFAYMTFGLQ